VHSQTRAAHDMTRPEARNTRSQLQHKHQKPVQYCVPHELYGNSNLFSRIHSWPWSHLSGAGLFVFCLTKV